MKNVELVPSLAANCISVIFSDLFPSFKKVKLKYTSMQIGRIRCVYVPIFVSVENDWQVSLAWAKEKGIFLSLQHPTHLTYAFKFPRADSSSPSPLVHATACPEIMASSNRRKVLSHCTAFRVWRMLLCLKMNATKKVTIQEDPTFWNSFLVSSSGVSYSC